MEEADVWPISDPAITAHRPRLFKLEHSHRVKVGSPIHRDSVNSTAAVLETLSTTPPDRCHPDSSKWWLQHQTGNTEPAEDIGSELRAVELESESYAMDCQVHTQAISLDNRPSLSGFRPKAGGTLPAYDFSGLEDILSNLHHNISIC